MRTGSAPADAVAAQAVSDTRLASAIARLRFIVPTRSPFRSAALARGAGGKHDGSAHQRQQQKPRDDYCSSHPQRYNG